VYDDDDKLYILPTHAMCLMVTSFVMTAVIRPHLCEQEQEAHSYVHIIS